MRKIFFAIFILSSILCSSQEKRNCGTNERLELYRQSHPESIRKSQLLEQDIQKWIDENANTKTNAITIPVVVHVIYKNNSDESYLIVCKNQICSNKIKSIEKLKAVTNNYAI